MKIKTKENCPLNNFEPCKQLECAWFLQLRGTHPQTGEELDDWGCSIAWIPMLLVENSRQQAQTGAAVESFRNEMVKSNEISNQVLLAAATANNPNMKIIEVNNG